MKLSEKAKEVIHSHAGQAFPNECVGFLFGTETERREINFALPIENAKRGDQRRRFEISPTDYIAAEKYAEDSDLDLLGIYHSHPLHPAIPSEHDRKQAVPFFSYIIVSVEDSRNVVDTTSWRLNERNEFEQESIDTLYTN